jgi:hypothetical protein
MAYSSFGQNLSVTGKVVDSLNQPIEYANVVAINPETKAIASFSITNTEGKFKLQLSEGQSYMLKVSFVGFRTFEEPFTPSKDLSENIIIELSFVPDYMKEVQVVHEMPVMMSGDTLIYKTEAFTDGRERKLQDVLAKLPGMEVDENGEVSVQGIKVNKVLVDGKQFFDGDTKMATKNIPANAVDRVQVLKDYNEVSPLNGMRGEDNLALNIQLKADKKNIVFGDLSLGLGLQKRYLAHANLFYYSPKLNVNLITDANNIGDLAFTMQDYFRFSGGLSNFASNSGSDIKLTNESLGFPTANRESAIDLSAQLGALNFTYNPSKKWSHTGFMLSSQSENEFGSNSIRTYLQSDSDNTEQLISRLNTNSQSGLIKYSSTYTPSLNTHLQYAFFGKVINLESLNNRNSQFAQSENNITEMEEQFSYSIDQQLMLYHSYNEKNIFSFEASFNHDLQNPNFTVMGSNNPFPNLLSISSDSTYQLLQDRNIVSNHSIAEGNYYRILNKKNHLNFSAGLNHLNQKMTSRLRSANGNLTSEMPDRMFQNDLSYQLTDVYAGLHLKSKLGDFTVKPGLNFHHYNLANFQNEKLAAQNINLVLPSFYSKWAISSTQSLIFRYNAKAEFVDIQKLTEGVILTDYNALFSGNRLLENGIYHSGNLYYNYFNFFVGMNMYANFTLMRKMNDFGNQVRFEGVERINSLVNLEQANQSFQSQLGFDKKFNLFKVSASVDFNGFSNNSFINESLNVNQSFNQNYKGAIQTTVYKTIELEGGYQFQYNRYESNLANNIFANHKPYLKLDWNLFKNFDLITDYDFNYYSNAGSNTSSTFEIWNATLRYHQKSAPWEFRLSAYNVLDTEGILRDSFNENLISTYEYFIQPRYFMLAVKYDL